MSFDEWIKTIGGYASLITLLGFFLCAYLQYRFNRQLQEKNADIQRELAQVFSELAESAKRKEITFNSLYTKRADVIVELYKRIVLTDRAINKKTNFCVPGLGFEDLDRVGDAAHISQVLTQNANASFSELFQFIDIHKIYFPKGLFNQLEAIRTLALKKLVLATDDKKELKVTNEDIDKLDELFEKSLDILEAIFMNMLEGKEVV